MVRGLENAEKLEEIHASGCRDQNAIWSGSQGAIVYLIDKVIVGEKLELSQ